MNDQSNYKDGFIPSHGEYRKLYSYQKAEIIYDGTVYFNRRYSKKVIVRLGR